MSHDTTIDQFDADGGGSHPPAEEHAFVLQTVPSVYTPGGSDNDGPYLAQADGWSPA